MQIRPLEVLVVFLDIWRDLEKIVIVFLTSSQNALAMLLHRYFGSHACDTLKEAKLLTSKITDFNDPFEFMFVTKGTLTAKLARKYVETRLNDFTFRAIIAQNFQSYRNTDNKNKWLEKNVSLIVAHFVKNSAALIQLPFQMRNELAHTSSRIVCLSNSAINLFDEILLWSHYARMHTGVRIGFDLPMKTESFFIHKVQYSKSPPEIDVAEALSTLELGDLIVRSARIKSLAWEYEDEYRLITHPNFCERRAINSKEKCFLPFDRKWVKTVDFGVRCSDADITDVLDVLKTDYSKDVKCRKAMFHKSEYALEFESII